MKEMKVIRKRRGASAKRKKKINKHISASKTAVTALRAIIAVAVVSAAVFGVTKLISYLITKSYSDRINTHEAIVQQLSPDESAQLTVAVGEIYKLTLPDGIDVTKADFQSSDSEVIRVDSSGRADAMKEGKATVTATYDGAAAACSFVVTEAEEDAKPKYITTAFTANEDIEAKNKKKSKDDLYHITVNRRTNTVTVYTYDDKGKYTVPVRAMVASCGKSPDDITPTGEFYIYFKKRWQELYGKVYGQYVSGFFDDYLFHSVPYFKSSPSELETVEFNKLSTNASQGCVRMMVSDTKWIYDNCPLNTPVKVIDSSADADPLGTPPTVKIDAKLRWDPTDPDKNNPYKDKTPLISGAKDIAIKLSQERDLMDGVTAVDLCGNDITADIALTGTVLNDKVGEYYITYSVSDSFGLSASVTVKVTVEASQ